MSESMAQRLYRSILIPSISLPCAVLLNVNKAVLKGKFSSGIEGALPSKIKIAISTGKQLSEMILSIFLLMFSKFFLSNYNIDSETAEI